jgi:nuclear transport factor 2 (NTF2) superfamily protein
MYPQLPSTAKCTEMAGLHHSMPPQHVLLAYTADSYWRKRAPGSDQPEMVAFLIRNWAKELGGGLIKDVWARSGAKITDRFVMRLDRSSHRPRGLLGSHHHATTGNDRN